MANVEVSIPNLVSGQRYRMVVESTTNPSLVGPSIEFVVPPTPRLLSSYQPLYSVVSEPWSITTATTTTTAGATISAGSIQAAGNYSKSITGWKRGNNIYPPYQFYVNNIANLGNGQQFTVNAMSDTAGGEYYDRLIYTVQGQPSAIASPAENDWLYVVNATAIIPTPVPSGFTTAWKNAGGAPLVSSTRTSNNGTLSFSLPAIPATDQTATSTTKTTSSTESGTKYHVDVSVPQEISTSLINTSTMFDKPVFFYIKNGSYFYLDDTSASAYPPSLASKPSTIPLTERNADMASQTETATRDYRFTIARYELMESSWVGYWVQKNETYETIGPSFSRVIFSQSAVRAGG